MPRSHATSSPRQREHGRVRVGWAIALVVLAGLVWGWRAGHLELPPEHDPWAPLDVAAEPNWLTPFKLRRTKGEVFQHADRGDCRVMVSLRRSE